MRKTTITAVLITALLFALLPGGNCPEKKIKAAEHGLSGPRVKNEIVTWDCIYFGSYWQNDTNKSGKTDKKDRKEPIKWRVLSVDGDDAFLLADKVLDNQQYNSDVYTDELGNEIAKDTTWETCTLRNWLNSSFYQDAFSEEEQNAIMTTTVVNDDNPKYKTRGGNTTMDKVYLLSLTEVKNPDYGFLHERTKTDTRKVEETAYATEKLKHNYAGGDNDWWLRSPGSSANKAVTIDYYGKIWHTEDTVKSWEYSVRPVLHLNLASGVWKKAGQVSAIRTSPSKVEKLRIVKKSAGSVTLTWKKMPDVTGYQICYYIPSRDKYKDGKEKKKLIKKNRNRISIKRVKRKNCRIFVRAYRQTGKQRRYGAYSNTVKV
ncbi:MAG: hypothetical protein J1F02_06570 [Lachnospiraceae bacterium]|nr:hypothetical protein [Lachnospiraceae bacterium]